ncbi:MAG: ABC transporter ATP-binding protein [Thermodesulfobacteriota bacterium]|nr:ABC transporter ATP-binding protein [Thermodesulfobacteriota bacterium]
MILEVKNLVGGYQNKRVLHGLSFSMGDGEVVGTIGHNGAGKTTLLKSLFGLLPPWEGQILFRSHDITGRKPDSNVKEGIAYMPQGQGLFPDLTVMENLEISCFGLDRKTLKKRSQQVFELFPILEERKRQRAGTLSGGEQRMMSVGLTLMHEPTLMFLDEPSLGLAPRIVQLVMENIIEINRRFKNSILLVEQNFEQVKRVAGKIIVIKLGQIVFSGILDPALDKRELWKYF